MTAQDPGLRLRAVDERAPPPVLGGRLGRSGGAGAGSGTGACGGSAGAAAAGQQGRRHGEGQRQCKKPLLHRVMSSSKIFLGVA